MPAIIFLGRELNREIDLLRQKLNTSAVFEDWREKVGKKTNTQNNRIFLVERQQRDGKVILRLKVNYLPEDIVVSKEVCILYENVFID